MPGSPHADEDRGRSIADQQAPHADAPSWVLVIGTLTLAGAVLFQTISNPGQHPFSFALAVAWLVSAYSGALTSELFFRQAPDGYRFWRWEDDGKVYQWFGLAAFRWVLLHTPLQRLNPNVRLRSGRSDFDRLLRSQRAAEGSHAIAALITLALAAWYSLTGHAVVGLWFFVVNIPLNLYPVMLQRWNRGRVQLALRRPRQQ
jgi:hypothetical protein